MSNPYLLPDAVNLVSFSGGRSSGMMLKKCLDANGGFFPSKTIVAFANTGRERPETLDFVNECEKQWGVPIYWLEWRDGPNKERFKITDYEDASRDGKPFADLIGKRGFLPNPVMRFCTQELKIRVIRDFMVSLGYNHWNMVIGFRADEMNRVNRSKGRKEPKWDYVFPMADAGASKRDVDAFWKSQPFDLNLKPHEGNCDLCFLKAEWKIRALMRDKPELADWWIQQEEKHKTKAMSADTFRADRPRYKVMIEDVQNQGDLFGKSPAECDLEHGCDTGFCTD